MPNLTVDDYTFAGLGLTDGRLRRILDTVPQMVWSTSVDGQVDFYNSRWYDFTGVPPGATDGDKWIDLVHPDDRDRAAEAWRTATASGEPYDVEYRLRHHGGEYCWIIARAQPLVDGRGRIARWLGTCTEIEDLKRTQAAHAMIAAELSHRIGNLFSVAMGLVSLSAPRGSAFRAEAEKLIARLSALARAHDRFRVPASHEAEGASSGLRDLLNSVMKPYMQDADGVARVVIEGDDLPIAESHASALALILHELATNAVKYGALSTDRGRIAITVRREPGGYRVTWVERGGPAIGQSARAKGFGTGLVRRLAALQLGEEPRFQWHPEGLEVELCASVK